MSRRFRQVDVFGTSALGGNPVAVVLDAEGLSTEDMVRFTAWTNLSECTFVLPPEDAAADYRVRIFAPGTELPFAGHPTLGTARAWLDAGGVPRTPGVIVQECGVGLVQVRDKDGRLAFTAPELLRGGPVEDAYLQQVTEILGIGPGDVVESRWIDNGPGWVGVLLRDDRAVLDLAPDASRHPGRWDIGVLGPCALGSPDAFEVRAFFTDGAGPLWEDPVTGSLNASGSQWMIDTGRASLPFVNRQGTAMGRDGRIHLSGSAGHPGPDGTLWVGGTATVVFSGEFRG
ncbi:MULTISPECIES: PhzF family phenazine biosynthesis protein [Arthrobacter]|uniref:PhzF family phenazine biosynthesis protein n=2 Tax=Arthrobacter TaxID=1663 RepID=A0ABU9KK80_9MICC|nr:PhzF family phenazine biosynthesis protein [Arthrobacter sp. YJM1]MDP5227090.1 PhzF family phenazine biosynthesis protein [Arthrobacter sp. YJM1]